MFDINSIFTFSMMINISLFFLFLYFLIKLSAKEEKSNSSNSKDFQDLTKSKEKSYHLLKDAMKNANKILVDAELRGLKLFSKEKLDSQKFAADYEQKVNDLETHFKNQFESRLNETEVNYKEFLAFIGKTLESHINQNQKTLEEKTFALIKHSDDLIASSVSQLEADVKMKLDKELDTVRQEIESYKKNRLHIIDENIVEILEKTVAIALGKKLSLTDHSDLIYKALEEAKKEHALQ